MPEEFPILAVSSPDGQIVRYDLTTSPLIIGRLAESDIHLDSPRVSRRHAELVREAAGCWRLRDLASRNGSRVNGEAITDRELEAGDIIEIGQFHLRIVSRDELEAEPDLQTTVWSAEETDATAFKTLSSSPAARLNSSHLAKITALGQHLLEIPQAPQRLVELCRVLVDPEMSCTSAVVLRMSRTNSQPPQLLCPCQLREGMTQQAGISRAVVEAAVKGQQPILAGGAISSGLTVNFADADRGVTAIIVCPLRIETASADVLYATVPHAAGTLDWLALAALAAEQFKKAELQIEARKSIRDSAAIQHELGQARKIQMSLVPKAPTARGLEIAIGFEPCLWIGGDYANVLPTSEGRTLLVIADVSGKGLPAAMVATGVHSVVASSASAGHTLAELAQSLNRFLIDSMERQSFLTMVAIVFDPRTGRAQCLNAGHPPMLVIDSNGEVREMPYGQNPPLGVVPTSPAIDFADLNEGDLLFVYTDGLSDMLDARGKMLGTDEVRDRMAAMYRADARVPLEELSAKLVRTLEEIRGASPVTDDRTFLLARRQD